jgi:hypothetical protein
MGNALVSANPTINILHNVAYLHVNVSGACLLQLEVGSTLWYKITICYKAKK